jgi:proteasome lid subunit RPN8/RPN11
MQRVHLPAGVVAAVREHARVAYPEECCGFLIGWRGPSGSRVEAAERALNRCVEAPQTGFAIDPMDYLNAERAAEARGLEMVGFYHSHPDAPPRPSATDLAFAWPNMVYLVASVQAGSPADLGAFVLDTERRALETISITEGPHG